MCIQMLYVCLYICLVYLYTCLLMSIQQVVSDVFTKIHAEINGVDLDNPVQNRPHSAQDPSINVKVCVDICIAMSIDKL